MNTTTAEFRPRATYVAGAAQVGIGFWMLLLPDAWSLGLLEMALGTATVVLAKNRVVNMLWVVALVPVVVGGLFMFSGGLLLALPGVVMIVSIAIDVLIGRQRA